jgi:subtilisin-like proprotein convertase family protein
VLPIIPILGDLEVTLTSPSGTVSRLAETHLCMDTSKTPSVLLAQCPTFYNSWVFGSSVHLGESTLGTWILTVTDRGLGDTGTLQSWGMKFYGR